MRDEHTPGTDSKQFAKEGAARNAILQMQRRVEELNDFIAAVRKDGYQVKLGVDGPNSDSGSTKIQVAIELPIGVENIRG